MKRLLCMLLVMLTLAPGAWAEQEEPVTHITPAPAEETTVGRTIFVTTNGETRTATLSDNASADAFWALLQDGDIVIDMHDYGGFEKVGPLGTEIVRSDEDITTEPGDIILYLGENVTIYYDVNRWDFTLLGHIDGATAENMRAVLGDGDPTVTFSLGE